MTNRPSKIVHSGTRDIYYLVFGNTLLYGFEDDYLHAMNEDQLSRIADHMVRAYYKGYFDGGNEQ